MSTDSTTVRHQNGNILHVPRAVAENFENSRQGVIVHPLPDLNVPPAPVPPAPEGLTADVLASRVAELEASIPGARAAIEAAEARVADAFASGSAANKELIALAQARDSLQGRIAALCRLEHDLYTRRMAEWEHQRALILAESEAAYREIRISLDETIMSSVLPVLAKLNLKPELAQRFKADLQAAAWSAIQEQAADRRREMTPAPKQPWPRDDLGQQIDTDRLSIHDAEHLRLAESQRAALLRRQ